MLRRYWVSVCKYTATSINGYPVGTLLTLQAWPEYSTVIALDTASVFTEKEEGLASTYKNKATDICAPWGREGWEAQVAGQSGEMLKALEAARSA